MANSETIKTTIDANINTNGKQAITGAVMNAVLKQMVDSTDAQFTELAEYTENPEYVRAYTDSEGKFLWGIKTDGSVEFAKGVPTPIQEWVRQYVSEAGSANDVEIQRINQLIAGLQSDVAHITDTYYQYNDVEGRTELTLDTQDKVLSYRDKDGVKHEVSLKVDKRLVLSADAMTEFQRDLKAGGFNVDSPIDWSRDEFIQISIPSTCAKVNIKASRLPSTKTDDISAVLEFWDKSGNYFKKPIVLNAQGSSSMAYELKNLSIDIDDGSSIKFGHWVSQDSFHLKVYYIDIFRGINNINYNYAESIISYLKCRASRYAVIGESSPYNGTGTFKSDFNKEAMCHPDGFPFELYLNGQYCGLYAWNLKKHRDNYMQDKNDATSTILDGYLDGNTFWRGSIDWTQFELRNPKNLATMDGREYDADTNCYEIIDETSEYYDPGNKAHANSAVIKPILKRMAGAMAHISSLPSADAKKAYFEEVFDKEMMICYFIVSNVVDNWDAFAKNWIWTVYHGGKAAPNFYDMDSCYGRWFTGTHVKKGGDLQNVLGIDSYIPTKTLYELYPEEIKEVYADLRRKGLVDVDYIMEFFAAWIARVGYDTYERCLQYYPDIPSYRDSHINGEYWEFDRASGSSNTYSNDTDYVAGDEVYYGSDRFYKFICKKNCKGVPPIAQFYRAEPRELGMYDTPERIKSWLVERIAFLDGFFGYSGEDDHILKEELVGLLNTEV